MEDVIPRGSSIIDLGAKSLTKNGLVLSNLIPFLVGSYVSNDFSEILSIFNKEINLDSDLNNILDSVIELLYKNKNIDNFKEKLKNLPYNEVNLIYNNLEMYEKTNDEIYLNEIKKLIKFDISKESIKCLKLACLMLEQKENYIPLLSNVNKYSTIIQNIILLTRDDSFRPNRAHRYSTTDKALLDVFENYKYILNRRHEVMHYTKQYRDVYDDLNTSFIAGRLVLDIEFNHLNDPQAFLMELKNFILEIYSNIGYYNFYNNINYNGLEDLKRDIFNLRFRIKNLDSMDISDELKDFLNNMISIIIDTAILEMFHNNRNFNKFLSNIDSNTNFNKILNALNKKISSKQNFNSEKIKDINESIDKEVIKELKSASKEAINVFVSKVVNPFIAVLGVSGLINLITQYATDGTKYYNFYYEMANQPFIQTSLGPVFWAAVSLLIGTMYAVSTYKHTKQQNKQKSNKAIEKPSKGGFFKKFRFFRK